MSYPIYTVPAGDVLPVLFSTYDGGTGASITLTGLAVTDIEIYKDGSTTQRASDAGYTLLDTDGIDFDGITGIHGFSIDTGDNTDSGFYTVGAWFHVVVSAVTIDAQTVNFIACAFRIMAAEDAPGVPDVNTTHIAGSAVSTSSAQIGVNVVNAGGTAWGSGAITAASIASNAIADTKIASGAITSAKFATGAITAGVIAADAIGASELAADAVAEIADAVWDEAQSGHTTGGSFGEIATEIASILDDTDLIDDGTSGLAKIATDVAAILVDTSTTLQDELDGIQADTEDIQSKIGSPSDFGSGTSTLAANLQDLADNGTATYDRSTDSLQAIRDRGDAAWTTGGGGSSLEIASGTIGATGNDTTHLHLDGLAYADDALNDLLIVVYDDSAGLYYSTWITDWANTGDLATVNTLPFTPEASTDTYVVLAIRQDVTGGSGLDAAGVRDAIGLASANLDTQLAALPTAAEVVNEWESQSQADPTGFHVNVMEVNGTAQTANDNGADINAILADTNELQTDWVNGGRLDLIVDAILADTNELQTDDTPGALSAIDAKIDTIDGNVDDIETAVGALSIPTAGDIADAVWDEDATAHQTGGTFGQAIGDPGANTETIYDAVVTDAAGTNVAADIIDIEGKVDDLEGRLTATRAGYLDNLSGGAVALEATAQSILDDTDDIGVAGAGLTEAGGTGDHLTALATAAQATAIEVDTQDIQGRIPTALVGGRIDATVDGTGMESGAVDAILDEVVEGSYTFRQFLRLFAAALGGELSGAATTTITIRDASDTKDRITATVDADGNRSTITLDLT